MKIVKLNVAAISVSLSIVSILNFVSDIAEKSQRFKGVLENIFITDRILCLKLHKLAEKLGENPPCPPPLLPVIICLDRNFSE